MYSPLQERPIVMEQMSGEALDIARVISWLRQNYAVGDKGSIAKAAVYDEYLQMCRRNRMQETSRSFFGKIVRLAFPGIVCARKGPRGSSKHHYKGLRKTVRPADSPDEQDQLDADRQTRWKMYTPDSSTEVKVERQPNYSTQPAFNLNASNLTTTNSSNPVDSSYRWEGSASFGAIPSTSSPRPSTPSMQDVQREKLQAMDCTPADPCCHNNAAAALSRDVKPSLLRNMETSAAAGAAALENMITSVLMEEESVTYTHASSTSATHTGYDTLVGDLMGSRFALSEVSGRTAACHQGDLVEEHSFGQAAVTAIYPQSASGGCESNRQSFEDMAEYSAQLSSSSMAATSTDQITRRSFSAPFGAASASSWTSFSLFLEDPKGCDEAARDKILALDLRFAIMYEAYFQRIIDRALCFELGWLRQQMMDFWCHLAPEFEWLLSFPSAVRRLAALDAEQYERLARMMKSNPLRLKPRHWAELLFQFVHFFPVWIDESNMKADLPYAIQLARVSACNSFMKALLFDTRSERCESPQQQSFSGHHGQRTRQEDFGFSPLPSQHTTIEHMLVGVEDNGSGYDFFS